MTDKELDKLSIVLDIDKLVTEKDGYISSKTANHIRKLIKDLISDVKKAREERNWLAEQLGMWHGRIMDDEICPEIYAKDFCERDIDCKDCWLKAAEERTK